jgi:catechol 2,3-dioxygenase-like lactoylglutathione lyase family enzyme
MTDHIKRTNTIVYCVNWAKTVAFYRDRLGLEIAFQNDWFVEFRLTDRSFLSIADQSRATVSSAQGKGLTLSFQIEDITTIHRRLIRDGLSPTDIRTQVMGGDVFYLRDPEGNRVEFWCPSRP